MDKGVGYPFTRGDRGYFKESSGLDLIEGNIMQIIGTIPGERVMLPEFGCKIRQVLFDHINAGTLALAKTYVIDAIKRWEGRVVLISTEVLASEDESYIRLVLNYRYKETGEEKMSSFAVNKEGVKLVGTVGTI